MNSNANDSNIIKFKKRRHLNIGLVIFGIIFIYLLATVVMYITAPRVTVYEVRQGSILKDNAYTGLAIRDEIVVQATEGGYINYYTPNCSKAKSGAKIYTLSSSPLDLSEAVTDTDVELSSEEKRTITTRIQSFNNDFDESNFDVSYQLKNELQNTLVNLSNNNLTNQLDVILSQNGQSGVQVYNSQEDGIIVHSTDGLENLTVETVSLSHFDKDKHKKTEYSSNSKVAPGDNVYKIVTNENWTLMLDLEDETAELLKDKNYVKVNFNKDDHTLWATMELKQIDGHNIAYLYFEQAMIRYASDRYLDVELILEDETGLKIPKTAVTEKEFYVVPVSYITQGGNSSSDGVIKQSFDAAGNVITELKNVDIYYETDEVVYLDPNAFDLNTVITKPESNETMKLDKTASLQGVYCINKGYAVFKQINILCESDTYYIIEEGNSFGLSNFDHIALDSSNIKENDVVF